MKQTLSERALEIKNTRQKAADSVAERIATERAKQEKAILESFKSTFNDYIPMIEEEGIEISAHFKSVWEYKGSYIQFRKNDKILRMDYQNAMTYRYEYTKPDAGAGRSVYGTWPKEDLVLFIYEGLISKLEDPDVVPGNFE